MKDKLVKLRLRAIEQLLSAQLHDAEETLRLAKVHGQPQDDLNRSLNAYNVALNRWQMFVIEGVVPEDLKDWNAIGTPPNHR
jgi:hypothetical protein